MDPGFGRGDRFQGLVPATVLPQTWASIPGMFTRHLVLLTVVAALLALKASGAGAQDIDTCYATADRVANGEAVSAEDKRAGHEACQAALAATSSVVQKSQIQDADFDIVGRPPQKAN